MIAKTLVHDPELLVLDDDGRPRRQREGRGAHLFPRVPHHDHEPLRGELARRRERMPEQGPPRHRVQDLRGAGLHPGALARGKDHDCGRGSFAHE